MEEKTQNLDEQRIDKKFEHDADGYIRQYSEILEEASEAYNEINKGGREWSVYDTVALGRYLNTWESYKDIFESDPTTRDVLGDYLKVGLGLVAVQYASLPATFFASVQPLADEVGMIYYRELVATMARGSISDNQVIGTQEGSLSYALDSYFGEEVTSTTAVSAGAGTYNISLSAPVRPRSLEITIAKTNATAATYTGIDDGNGNIYGSWSTGSDAVTGGITYSNGAVVINLSDSGWVGSITIKYHQNLAQAAQIPGFHYRLASKAIRTNYFILSNEYSTLADFLVRKRFGMALTDDIAAAAVAQINSSVLSSMITKLKAAAVTTGTATWSAVVPDGVSTAEHRRTFTDSLEAAAQLIDAKTNRGAISFIIAGSYGRRILRTLGVSLTRKALPGPYLMGFYEGIPVFYAPASLVANDELYVGYRGPAWFEAPLVYAPFLPIVTVQGSASGNPFNRLQGVAHSAAVDTVMPGFCAKITISGM